MIAILHTWGADIKYHVHLHTLITFGGLDKEHHWQHPKRKNKLARYRQINRIFREEYLKGLQKLLKNKALKEVFQMEALLEEVQQKNWVVNNGLPQVNTQNIEEYLSRYINKIAVSNSSLTFNQAKNQVELIHNDYRNQITGQAAPKKVKIFDPLSFIHQFLQHLPPRHFQRLRYYGLHASIKQAKIKDQIPPKIKRNGATVRTVMQIIRALLGVELLKCEKCGNIEFDKTIESPDNQWLAKNVRGYKPKPRGSPNHQNNPSSRSNPHLEKSTLHVANGEKVTKKHPTATKIAS
jgi:hypothetical protein